MEKHILSDFDEYIQQGEPSKVEKSQIWKTAIGLQQVDGLTPSIYLIETAKENIEGDITFEEVKNRIDIYYKTQINRQINEEDRTEEADKVSARIAEILSEKTFSFTPTEYINIHRRLFSGIYKFAGKIRDYNISKSEWALKGASVLYAGADNLKATLEYDFEKEKKFRYKGLSQQQLVEHIAQFVADLWQIHIFGEGNTRTTAVFLIKYLRKLGFDETGNDLFAQHSWYFRNALVRANYNNARQRISSSNKYLELFLANILFGEKNELKNRRLHIDFNSSEENGGQKTAQGGQKRWSEKVVRMIEIMNGKPTITRKELSDLLQINSSAIQKHINNLKNEGILVREGSDKKGIWKVIKKNDLE